MVFFSPRLLIENLKKMDFWFGLFFKNTKHKDIITLLVHHDASIKYFLPAKGFA